jgi:tetratricopeptide (TPR) repeat protein
VPASFEQGDYAGARAVLERAVAQEGPSHWLLTRIGTTFYGQRRYTEALSYAKQAQTLAPRCPLVLWDLAGTHQMLGEHARALTLYGRLIARGVDRVAHDECGEGVAWARGLIADAHYRSALSLSGLGRRRAARNALDRSLALRGPGTRSIYPIDDIRTLRTALADPRARRTNT